MHINIYSRTQTFTHAHKHILTHTNIYSRTQTHTMMEHTLTISMRVDLTTCAFTSKSSHSRQVKKDTFHIFMFKNVFVVNCYFTIGSERFKFAKNIKP